MKGGKKAANWLGSQNKKNATMMRSLCFLLPHTSDLELKRLATQKHKQPQTKKKKTKKTLLQKKSGLGPGKRNLARQKTFRHKLLNPSQSMVLVKNTDSELHPRLLESAT